MQWSLDCMETVYNYSTHTTASLKQPASLASSSVNTALKHCRTLSDITVYLYNAATSPLQVPSQLTYSWLSQLGFTVYYIIHNVYYIYTHFILYYIYTLYIILYIHTVYYIYTHYILYIYTLYTILYIHTVYYTVYTQCIPITHAHHKSNSRPRGSAWICLRAIFSDKHAHTHAPDLMLHTFWDISIGCA